MVYLLVFCSGNIIYKHSIIEFVKFQPVSSLPTAIQRKVIHFVKDRDLTEYRVKQLRKDDKREVTQKLLYLFNELLY